MWCSYILYWNLFHPMPSGTNVKLEEHFYFYNIINFEIQF